MKKTGIKEMNGVTHGMKAIWPMIKSGTKASGLMKICATWMSMGIYRK